MQQAVVSETMKGIRRTLGTAQPGKEPLLTADILKMLDALGGSLLGSRDRALLLVGFAGGFRRSEIVSLDVEDVSETADGLVVRLRRSKTDPEAKGTTVWPVTSAQLVDSARAASPSHRVFNPAPRRRRCCPMARPPPLARCAATAPGSQRRKLRPGLRFARWTATAASAGRA
jgi:integrase